MIRAPALAAVVVLALSACATDADPDATPSSGAGAEEASGAAPVTPDRSDPSPTVEPEPEATIAAFDPAAAMAVVERLSVDIGPRPAGSAEDRDARAYVVDAFRASGWTVREEAFDLPQGGTSANVIATPPRVSLDAPHLVVGAHLDTVAGAPGANDNATGVGVLVAIATELADELDRLPEPVVLVAFGAEEYQPSDPRQHHVGSTAYVAAHGAQVPAMLSVDMVGNGPATCICIVRDTYDDLARLLADVAAEAGIDGVAVEARGDISDHGPFALAGIPAAFLWSYDDDVRHTPGDTIGRVRPDDVARAGSLVLAWLRGVGRPE